MELDNIIYIVATIVIFVVSLLGQNKKKKVKTQVAEQDEEVTYSLNDFEKILERKQEYKQQEETFEQENTEEKEEPIVEEVKEELNNKEKESKKVENENNDGFDVKSAIIYSSIIERKKFRH
jgi:hypothetical protein